MLLSNHSMLFLPLQIEPYSRDTRHFNVSLWRSFRRLPLQIYCHCCKKSSSQWLCRAARKGYLIRYLVLLNVLNLAWPLASLIIYTLFFPFLSSSQYWRGPYLTSLVFGWGRCCLRRRRLSGLWSGSGSPAPRWRGPAAPHWSCWSPGCEFFPARSLGIPPGDVRATATHTHTHTHAQARPNMPMPTHTHTHREVAAWSNVQNGTINKSADSFCLKLLRNWFLMLLPKDAFDVMRWIFPRNKYVLQVRPGTVIYVAPFKHNIDTLQSTIWDWNEK